jgi:hypothetical protein
MLRAADAIDSCALSIRERFTFCQAPVARGERCLQFLFQCGTAPAAFDAPPRR